MRSSSAPTVYIAVLLIAGLALAAFGTALPLGGGVVVALLGAAAIAAGLTLIGVRLILAGARDTATVPRSEHTIVG